MSGNRAPKSGFAAEAQRKVRILTEKRINFNKSQTLTLSN